MSVQTAAYAANQMEMIQRLERLARQTSLVALETALEAAEDGIGTGRMRPHAHTARDVASHIIRASLEMQQTTRLYR